MFSLDPWELFPVFIGISYRWKRIQRNKIKTPTIARFFIRFVSYQAIVEVVLWLLFHTLFFIVSIKWFLPDRIEKEIQN